MLRGQRRGPIARQKDHENHRHGNKIPKPEAAPDPKREDSAGGGNQEPLWLRPIITEKNFLHSCAEQTNRAGGERFLDPMAIETRSGGRSPCACVTSRREDQEENTTRL